MRFELGAPITFIARMVTLIPVLVRLIPHPFVLVWFGLVVSERARDVNDEGCSGPVRG